MYKGFLLDAHYITSVMLIQLIRLLLIFAIKKNV